MGLFSLSACYNDKEEILYPSQFNCDDIQNISYSADVVPILQNHCYACHNASDASQLANGNNLEDFTTISNLANGGTLISSLKQDGTSEPMPRNAPKLSECNIKIIETWINEGANNN